jgi:hypothetical protein
MIIELNMLDIGGLPVNIDILLFGNDDLSVEINTFIFSCVQKYIKDTRRFMYNVIDKPSMQYTKISVSKRKIRRYSFRLKIFLLQFGFKRRDCRQLTKVQI